MGIILAVIASILLGFSNFLLKKSFRDLSPSIAFFIFAVFSVILWAPAGLALGVNFERFISGVIVGMLSAILGQAIYIYVLEKGELSITATILQSFAIYTVIFSILFNHEHPDFFTLIFVLLTLVGTVIVSLPDKIKNNEFKKVNYITWAIFAAACIGASDTIAKNFINHVSVGTFLFFVSLSQLLISLVYLRFDKQPLSQFLGLLKNFSDYKFAFFGSLFIALATLSLFVSFNFTFASIASPIVASSPIITIILALIFLKEKVSKKNWIGLSLVLLSIICIGFLNP